MVLCVVLVALFIRLEAEGKPRSARSTLSLETCAKFLLLGVLGSATAQLGFLLRRSDFPGLDRRGFVTDHPYHQHGDGGDPAG